MLSALQLLDNSLNGMSDLHTLAAPEEELSFPCGATTSRIRGGGRWEGKEEKSIPPCSNHLESMGRVHFFRTQVQISGC